MNKIKKNPILAFFLCLIPFILIAYFLSNLGLFAEFNLWSLIDAYATSLTLFLVFHGLREDQKQIEKVGIYFNDNKLNLDIARKDFSRSELQGILGILRVDIDERYKIKYLSDIEFLDSIYKIQKSELNELRIKLTEDELKGFRNDIYENINNN